VLAYLGVVIRDAHNWSHGATILQAILGHSV
jgi:hypothetical protein